MTVKSSLFLAPLVFAVACGSAVGPDGSDGTDPIDDPSDPGDPTVSKIAGSYEVTSKYDLSASADLPALLGDALGPLSGLSDNPAGTLIDVLKGTNSSVADAIDSLPPILRSLLEQQINTYLEDQLFENTPVAEQIVDYVDMISTMLTNFEVVTTLEVGNADEAGNANANHTLAGVAFPKDGQRTFVATPDILNTLSIARDVSLNIDLGAKSVAVGDHAFNLPLGDFAVTGFHAALESQFGIADLGEALNEMVDCTGLASEVGDICIDSFCILDEAQIADFCVQGLDQVAEQVDNKIRDIEFAELHMVGGEGAVQVAEKVNSISGNWDSEFGINGNNLSVPSSFEAVRK